MLRCAGEFVGGRLRGESHGAGGEVGGGLFTYVGTYVWVCMYIPWLAYSALTFVLSTLIDGATG